LWCKCATGLSNAIILREKKKRKRKKRRKKVKKIERRQRNGEGRGEREIDTLGNPSR
jgi:hypothetical protein